jgi:hypothetical protein
MRILAPLSEQLPGAKIVWGCWHLSANITKFTVKTCFSHILLLCSTEPIVHNFTPLLYIAPCYTLEIGFFWGQFFQQHVDHNAYHSKVLEIKAVYSMEYIFRTHVH